MGIVARFSKHTVAQYYRVPLVSLCDPVRAFGPDLQRAAQKKLRLLNAASELNSLRVPPGNRLEQLAGDRAGQTTSRSLTTTERSGP